MNIISGKRPDGLMEMLIKMNEQSNRIPDLYEGRRVTNLSILRTICNNNDALIAETIEWFIKRSSLLIPRMKQHLEKNELDQVYKCASQLSSGISTIAKKEYSLPIRLIQEYALAEKNQERLLELVEDIEEWFILAEKELRKEISE